MHRRAIPMHVVVVESPAKARTLRGYLGTGHTVIATRATCRTSRRRTVRSTPRAASPWCMRRSAAPRARSARSRRRSRTPRRWCSPPTPTARARRSPRRRRWTTGPSGGPRPCGALRRVRQSRPEVRTLPLACTEAGVRRCRRDVRHRARGRGVPAAALRSDSRIYDGPMENSANHTIV